VYSNDADNHDNIANDVCNDGDNMRPFCLPLVPLQPLLVTMAMIPPMTVLTPNQWQWCYRCGLASFIISLPSTPSLYLWHASSPENASDHLPHAFSKLHSHFPWTREATADNGCLSSPFPLVLMFFLWYLLFVPDWLIQQTQKPSSLQMATDLCFAYLLVPCNTTFPFCALVP